MTSAQRDWQAWHAAYADPASSLAQRLKVVQARLADALSLAPAGPVRLISMCAGQGRDVIPVLARHPRGREVQARLVELDPELAADAGRAADAAGLPGVSAVTGDAGLTSAYAGLVPADIVMVCGVFGNVTGADIERTISACTGLCAAGGTVLWTRGRTAPDLVPQICAWFAERGFELVWLSEPGTRYGVGRHRLTGQAQPLAADARMFTFAEPATS
jgi:hypothetical protein